MNNSPTTSNSGQILIEAVLLMVVMLSILITASKYAKDNEFIQSMIKGPWAMVAGMIENGDWVPAEQGRANHPNHLHRHTSFVGDKDL